MPAPSPASNQTAHLTAALRAIRRRRNLKAADVARRMGLKLRTYQHFEAGRSQLDWPRIQAFALATDSDPHAILGAVIVGSPQFAVRSMDNKLASALVVAMRRFDDRLGDAISRFEVGRLIAAFRKMFDDLEAELAARDAEAARWLQNLGPRAAPEEPDEDA